MTRYRSVSALSLAEPKLTLQAWVDRAVVEGVTEARERGSKFLHVRTERFGDDIPLAVFDSSVTEAHLLWNKEFAVLGLGVAKVFNPKVGGSSKVRKALDQEHLSDEESAETLVMGGWAFPDSGVSNKKGPWSDFSVSRWVIPALTTRFDRGGARVTVAVEVSPESKPGPLRAKYRRLASELERRRSFVASLPVLKTTHSVPSLAKWRSLAEEAIDSISKQKMRKVVLARGLSLSFKSKVSASLVARRLIALNPDSTVFAIKRHGSVFLGATPERLASAKDGEVTVDCLAASTPRGEDAASDKRLGAELLADSKSNREHQLVVEAAVSALSPISSRVEVPGAPVLKKLTVIQHLFTPVKATLRQGQDVWSAAAALWPNPAIGGEPREKAVEWIQKFEKLNRGLYSGVVGHFDARLDRAELVVAIRSGVIRGKRAVIYAGAGLVAGSKPREELEETGWKLRTMANALGIDITSGA